MVRPLFLAALVLSAPLVAVAQGPVAPNPYIEDRDTEVQQEAARAATEYCSSDSSADIDVEAGREDLLDALGGENFMLDILKEAKNQDDLQTKIREQVSIAWIIKQAVPIIMGILVFLCWFCWCWTVCPCCRCCRRCCFQRKHDPTKIQKIVVAVVLTGCLLGVIYGATQTMSGYADAAAGFETMACESAKVLDTALAGSTDPPFVGLMPILETVHDFDKMLEDGSKMLVDVGSVLDSTKVIEDAVLVATGTLDLLSSMIGLEQNVRPKSSSGANLMHTCEFCTALADPLSQASSALGSGVGKALADARGEVAKQLGPSQRQDLQAKLQAGTEPLVQFKTSVRDTFAGFVEPGAFETLKEQVDTTVYYSVNAFCALSIIILVFALISFVCWAFREQRDGKYTRTPYCFAGCSSCCGCLFVIPVFLIGGVLMAVSVPLSGLCLTMSDLDGAMVTDISDGLGMNFSGDMGEMLVGMVDNCMAKSSLNTNANLMDIIFTRNTTSNVKIYFRDDITSSVSQPVEAGFAGIESAMSAAGNVSITSSPAVTTLLSLIGANRVDAMMVADRAQISGDSRFSPMLTEASLGVALATSARCDNFTVGQGMGDLSGQVVPGITNFVEKMQQFGTVVPSASCIKDVICDPTASTSTKAACEAGRKYLTLKRDLVEAPTDLFRCDTFQNAAGVECDMGSMTQVNGQWVDDCLIIEGDKKVMRTKEKTCTLAEFAQYVEGFENRLNKAFSRLETSTDAVLTNIVDDLKGLVNRYILTPVFDIVNLITCGFMPSFYHGMVNGLCFQGVVGIRSIAKSYLAFANSVLVMAIIMYFTWRVTIDNVNDEKDAAKSNA